MYLKIKEVFNQIIDIRKYGGWKIQYWTLVGSIEKQFFF